MKIKINLIFLTPILAILITAPFFLNREKNVSLLLNGKEVAFTTKNITIKSFLSEIDFIVDPLDDISFELNSLLKKSNEIEINQVVRFSIHTENESIYLKSTSRMIGNILNEAKITYDSSTKILLNGKHSSVSDMIAYRPFYDLSVVNMSTSDSDDKEDVEFSFASYISDEIIHDFYSQNSHSNSSDISLFGLGPQLYNELTGEENTNIFHLTRVSEEVVLTQHPISFSTMYQPLSTIPLDTESTIQSGEYGLEAERSRIRYENGIEVSVVVEDTWLIKPPADRIIGYGTDITIQTLSTADGVIEYYRALEFYATSYSPSRSGVDPSISWYGQVYCGGNTHFGYVAVDLDYVPCGTQLYIPGYGFGIAMDTGNFDGAWIDLGYDDDNYVPWSKPVTVYFLTPVPPATSIPWVIPPGTTPFLPGFTY